MKWVTSVPNPTPPPQSVMRHGDVRVSVGPSDGNESQRWQYLMLTVGHHTTKSTAICLETWPRQAIAEARAALDEFESQLEDEPDGVL